MKQLKVLDCTAFCFPSLPSSLGCLINLQTLCLESCRQLQDIAMVGQLKKLEILCFRDSNIEQLPTEIGQLRRLQLLDLTNCKSLRVIPPNVMSKLSRLEELYMGDSFTKWEKEGGGGNASLVELKGLSKLTTLDIHIPSAEIIPQDLVSVELERFWISVGNERRWHDKYKTSRFMKFKGIEKITLLGNYRMKMLVKRTEDLFLKEIESLQNIVQELDNEEGFPQLKHLRIEKCNEILHIVSLVGQVHCKVFPLLESLSLHNLINLKKVCHGQLTEDQSFSKLRIIKVEKCIGLKHLFSFSMAKNLLQLQKITVGDCSNLEMIVGSDMEKSTCTLGYKKIISEDDSQVKVNFSSLEELYLHSLTSIENICHNQFQLQYQNLKKVILRNCKGLKYIFSYSMVNSLVQLEHLDIQSCESMKAVVVDTIPTGLGGRDEGKFIKMDFPKLNYLRLSGLPKLISFVIGMNILSIKFPSLPKLEITKCPNLIRFISMSSLDDKILTETQPHHFFDEKVALPNLMTLHVHRCNGLRSLMTLSMARSMVKLTGMRIYDCEKMEEIIQQNLGEEVKDDRIVSSQLKYLQLGNLPSLKSFCLGSYTLKFSSLEEVFVRGCKNMKTLMTLSVAQCMVKLTRMEIYNCDKMEEIIQQELGEEVKDDCIVFSQLKYLGLGNLPSLKSFCLGNYTLEFSSLEQVGAHGCQNMKTFSHGVLLTPKLHKDRYWEGNLNSTIQKKFKEMVGFRYIRDLRLSLYPYLKEKWHSQELPVSFFNKLRYLEVDGCTDMSSAIPMNLLRCLNNLCRLTVSNCDSLEDVFYLEELNIDEHFRPLLPKLKLLNLINLPKLRRFCSFTGNIIELHSLTRMRIENCPNMEAFVSNPTSIHMIEHKEPQEMTLEENFLIDDIKPFFNENVAIPRLEELELSIMPKLFLLRKESLEYNKLARSWVSFQNLMTLDVSGSEGLRSVMTLSRAESVEKLTIREMTQQVGEEVTTDIDLVFVHLKYLKLHRLPSLVSFCVGNYILEFPSLLQVIFS